MRPTCPVSELGPGLWGGSSPALRRLGDPQEFRPIPLGSWAVFRLWAVSDPGSSRPSCPQPVSRGLTLIVHRVVQLHSPVLLHVPALGALHILPRLHRLPILRVERRRAEGCLSQGPPSLTCPHICSTGSRRHLLRLTPLTVTEYAFTDSPFQTINKRIFKRKLYMSTLSGKSASLPINRK